MRPWWRGGGDSIVLIFDAMMMILGVLTCVCFINTNKPLKIVVSVFLDCLNYSPWQ